MSPSSCFCCVATWYKVLMELVHNGVNRLGKEGRVEMTRIFERLGNYYSKIFIQACWNKEGDTCSAPVEPERVCDRRYRCVYLYLLKFSWTRFSFMYCSSLSRYFIRGTTAYGRGHMEQFVSVTVICFS